MHINEATLKHAARRLNWDLLYADHKECISCDKGKAKQKKVSKTTESKATKVGERLFIDIS